jgi:hypothetical protein
MEMRLAVMQRCRPAREEKSGTTAFCHNSERAASSGFLTS